MKFLVVAILSMFAFLPPAVAQSSDTEAISQAIETLGRAMIAADAGQLERITLPQLMYGHSGGRVENQAAFIANLTSGKVRFHAVRVNRPNISVEGDLALVRHQAVYQVELGGKSSTVETELFQVWRKSSGAWKLLARQAFNPS